MSWLVAMVGRSYSTTNATTSSVAHPSFSKAMQYVLSGYLHLNPTRTNGAGSQGWQKDWGQKNQQAIQVPDSTVSFAKRLVARDARGEPAGK